MLRCYLQATADMAGNELAGIFLRTFVSVRVLALVQQQVIAYTAANEGLLDAGQGIYGMIDVEQRTVVRIQVGAYLGVDARRAFAFPADGLIPVPSCGTYWPTGLPNRSNNP